MTPPNITDAKALANKCRARGVIVLTFGGGQVAGSSYGHTRESCRDAGRILDGIIGRIESGECEIPESLSGSTTPGAIT